MLGGGKTKLLLTVDRLGSIQRAAAEFGMSYSHAWGTIQRVEQRAGFKVVETKLGGGRDRGTRLTPKGRAFVKASDGLFKDLRNAVEKRFRQKLQSFAQLEEDQHALVGQ